MPTSPQKISKLKSQRGMTLLEIMLVVALLAILAVFAVPRVASVFRVSVQSSVRRFSAMVKYTYDQAVMTGKVHRIHIDLEKQVWKVEATEAGRLPHQVAAEEFMPPGISKFDLEDKDDDKKNSQDPEFSAVKATVDTQIPKGVRVVAVDSWRLDKDKNPATRGEVSIYAFPNGYIDDAIVYLAEIGKEDLQQFKVTISSLTGRVQIESQNDKTQNAARKPGEP